MVLLLRLLFSFKGIQANSDVSLLALDLMEY